MPAEQRRRPRVEPPDVTATVPVGHLKIEGSVLDISRWGLAISIPPGLKLPKEGAAVSLELTAEGDANVWTLKNAVVQRVWDGSSKLKKPSGFALEFETEMDDELWEALGRDGQPPDERIEAQKRVLEADIGHLGEYRRDLSESQIRLFIMTWTVGVALASGYFALLYYGLTTHQETTPSQSFWRMLIGTLPGFLAQVALFMTIQLDITMRKVDSFIAVLKDMTIRNRYPREYKGWETAFRQYSHIFATSRCDACKRGCGELTKREREYLKQVKLVRDPGLDPYYMLMYVGYVAMVGVSLGLIVAEMLTASLGVIVYMLWEAVLLGIFTVTGAYIVRYLAEMRRGRFSFLYLKQAWNDILASCRQVF